MFSQTKTMFSQAKTMVYQAKKVSHTSWFQQYKNRLAGLRQSSVALLTVKRPIAEPLLDMVREGLLGRVGVGGEQVGGRGGVELMGGRGGSGAWAWGLALVGGRGGSVGTRGRGDRKPPESDYFGGDGRTRSGGRRHPPGRRRRRRKRM